MTPVWRELDGRGAVRAAPGARPAAVEDPRPSFASLRRELVSALPSGAVSIRFAAGICALSVRTLQRRLARAGLTYSDLIQGIRRDLALRLVRDPERRLIDIGQELGYDDPAHFTRAFRRWTGTAPRTYRELCRPERGHRLDEPPSRPHAGSGIPAPYHSGTRRSA